ncbi:hypothetical protein ABVT36_16380, partial [Microbulbifer sp. TYP-18]
TFRPVDGALQMGDTAPTLPDVPPPPPVDSDDGCGALGIIVLVVAAVVSGGAALAAYTAVSGAIAGIGALGGLAGVAGFVGGVAAAGIVSQGIMQTGAIIAGYQDGYSFSWKDVAKDGLIAAATFGIGELAGVGDKVKGLAEAQQGLAVAQQTKNAAEVARLTNQVAKLQQGLRVTKALVAGASSIASQGINKAFDSEYEFKWESVASAAIGSYASSWATDKLGFNPSANESWWAEPVRTITAGTINAGVQKLTENESFDWANVLNNAVGGYAGNRIGQPLNDAIEKWGQQFTGPAPETPKTNSRGVQSAETETATEQRTAVITQSANSLVQEPNYPTQTSFSWYTHDGEMENVVVIGNPETGQSSSYWMDMRPGYGGYWADNLGRPADLSNNAYARSVETGYEARVAAQRAAEQQQAIWSADVTAADYRPGKYGKMAIGMLDDMQADHDRAVQQKGIWHAQKMAAEGKRPDGTSLYGPYRDGYVFPGMSEMERNIYAAGLALTDTTANNGITSALAFASQINYLSLDVSGARYLTLDAPRGGGRWLPLWGLQNPMTPGTLSVGVYGEGLGNLSQLNGSYQFNVTKYAGWADAGGKAFTGLSVAGNLAMVSGGVYYNNEEMRVTGQVGLAWDGLMFASNGLLAGGPKGWLAWIGVQAIDIFGSDSLKQRMVQHHLNPKNKFSEEDLRLREEVEAKYDFMGYK